MIKARVIEVTDEKRFSLDGKDFQLRHVLFDIGDGRQLRTDLWGDRTPPQVGKFYKIVFEVTSERNKKDPKLFFHKIKLKHYEDYDRPLWQETAMEQRVRDTWQEDATW